MQIMKYTTDLIFHNIPTYPTAEKLLNSPVGVVEKLL